MVALFSSFIAKENTIATLGTLLGGTGAGLNAQLKTLLTRQQRSHFWWCRFCLFPA